MIAFMCLTQVGGGYCYYSGPELLSCPLCVEGYEFDNSVCQCKGFFVGKRCEPQSTMWIIIGVLVSITVLVIVLTTVLVYLLSPGRKIKRQGVMKFEEVSFDDYELLCPPSRQSGQAANNSFSDPSITPQGR